MVESIVPETAGTAQSAQQEQDREDDQPPLDGFHQLDRYERSPFPGGEGLEAHLRGGLETIVQKCGKVRRADWTVYEVNFGDSNNTYVSNFFGTVFDDQNSNGLKDSSELGIPGVTLSITDTFVGLPGPYTTNEWGQFTFPIEYTGIYTVTETDLPGYVSINAIPGHPAVTKIDNNNFRIQVSTLGIDFEDNLFAVMPGPGRTVGFEPDRPVGLDEFQAALSLNHLRATYR